MASSELQIIIGAVDKASKVFDDVLNKSKKTLDNISKETAKVGGAMLGVGTAAAAGIGKMFNEVDKGMDAVAIASGATGDQLKELQNVVNNIAKTTPASFEIIGKAVGEVNTRLNITGKENEEVSRKFVEMSRLLGTDVVETIRNVTRSMNDAGVSVKDASKYLDSLMAVSQATGVNINTLTDKMTTYGVQFRAIGFEANEAMAIMGKWEKEGVSTEKIFSGISKAVGKWGAEGKNTREEFWKLIEAIQNSDETTGRYLATQALGVKGAADFYDAVKQGRFELGNYTDIIKAADGAIQRTADNTDDYTEKLQKLKNEVLVELEPLLEKFASILADKIIPAISGVVDKIGGWIDANPELFDTILKLIGVLIGGGGLLLAFSGVTKAISGVISVFTFFTTPAGIVVAAIMGLIAVGVLLWQNWDTISAKCSEVWNKIKTTIEIQIEAIKISINNLIERFKAIPNDIWNALKNVGTVIKNAFSNIHIPLPHFSLGTQYKDFLGTKVALPDLKVDWYKRGGIFTKPSIIGVGEAGPEAVVPLNKAGTGAINITVTGNTFMGIEDFAEQIDEILMKRLKYNLKINSNIIWQ